MASEIKVDLLYATTVAHEREQAKQEANLHQLREKRKSMEKIASITRSKLTQLQTGNERLQRTLEIARHKENAMAVQVKVLQTSVENMGKQIEDRKEALEKENEKTQDEKEGLLKKLTELADQFRSVKSSYRDENMTKDIDKFQLETEQTKQRALALEEEQDDLVKSLGNIDLETETKIKKLHQLQFPPEQQTIVLKILNDEIEALKKASIETLKQDRLLTNRLSLLSTGGMDKQPDSNQ